jgi:hypothetical protein
MIYWIFEPIREIQAQFEGLVKYVCRRVKDVRPETETKKEIVGVCRLRIDDC